MTKAIATTLPTGSIDSYVSAAFQLPMLTAEQEREYALRLRDHDDLEEAGDEEGVEPVEVHRLTPSPSRRTAARAPSGSR